MKAITTVRPFPTDGSIKTLGWGVIAWIEDWLMQPDGDNAGEPFRLTGEQCNFILWWYAVDDTGRFRFRRSVFRRSKGHGKSPFLGALCLAELCGPVVFAGWDSIGEPVGKRHPMPWVIIAGVSETQTENTLSAIRAMLDGSDAVGEFGLDVGITRIYAAGGGKLHPITANAATQEGARPTFAVMDETHHWTRLLSAEQPRRPWPFPAGGGFAVGRLTMSPAATALTRPRDLGADFWLTRNRHGAGFWDGGWGDDGEP